MPRRRCRQTFMSLVLDTPATTPLLRCLHLFPGGAMQSPGFARPMFARVRMVSGPLFGHAPGPSCCRHTCVMPWCAARLGRTGAF